MWNISYKDFSKKLSSGFLKGTSGEAILSEAQWNI